MRKILQERIPKMIREEPDTVFMTVDIGMWMIRDILRDYPERAMNIGIFEDGMMSVAAGMALRGLVPTIYGIQPYLVQRAFEQIKLDFAYQEVGVNIIGTGAAVDYSKYGYSHYCAEDAGILKYIPGIEFIAPGTAKQFDKLFSQTYRDGKPTFFRLSDHPNKTECDVEFGKATVIQTGSKATVIAISTMLDDVIDACKGKDVSILYYTTLEPFDKKTLQGHYNNGNILICEPQYKGSMLNDVVDAFPDKSVTVRSVGFPREIFRNYGTYQDKMEHYGLDTCNILKQLRGWL